MTEARHPTRTYPVRRDIRWDPELGIMLRCPECPDRSNPGQCYWPVTAEFWYLGVSLQRCRACQNANNAARRRAIKDRADLNRRQRAYYHRKGKFLRGKRKRGGQMTLDAVA